MKLLSIKMNVLWLQSGIDTGVSKITGSYSAMPLGFSGQSVQEKNELMFAIYSRYLIFNYKISIVNKISNFNNKKCAANIPLSLLS